MQYMQRALINSRYRSGMTSFSSWSKHTSKLWVLGKSRDKNRETSEKQGRWGLKSLPLGLDEWQPKFRLGLQTHDEYRAQIR